MTDRGKLQQQHERGERAKRIVSDELVQEAFTALEKTILDAWKSSAADETRERDNAYLMYRLLQNFKRQFTVAVATGETARKDLLRINDPSKIKRLIQHGR